MAVLSDAEIDEALVAHPGWTRTDAGLHRELVFADFGAAFGFMARVALVAERLDHHPDWSNSWNRVVIDVTSHEQGGVTDRCLQLVEAVDHILATPPTAA